jgi:hypothetical protein
MPTSSTNHDVREKPKGSAREMRELSAKRGVREVCREKENFGKVILIKGKRVLNKIWAFICFALQQYSVLIPSTVQLCKILSNFKRPDGGVNFINFVNSIIYYC